MPSTLSSPKLELESTFQDASSLISNPPSSMRSEPELTDNSSTPSNSSQEKRMPPITSPEDITPLEKKLSISASTELESLLITALVFKASLCSTQSVVEPDPDSDHSFWRDSQSITERNPNSASLFTHHPKSLPLLLSHTTPSSQLTLFLSTLMSLSCSTTRLSMISAEEISILRDLLTPTSTDLFLKLSHPSLLPSDSTVP